MTEEYYGYCVRIQAVEQFLVCFLVKQVRYCSDITIPCLNRHVLITSSAFEYLAESYTNCLLLDESFDDEVEFASNYISTLYRLDEDQHLQWTTSRRGGAFLR